MMTYEDQAKAARRLRKEKIKVLRMCKCCWPIITYRNGSGHDDECPAHIYYLEQKDTNAAL